MLSPTTLEIFAVAPVGRQTGLERANVVFLLAYEMLLTALRSTITTTTSTTPVT